ncbi:collagen alpha-1(I) chain-like [Vidua macroura]|uniref:collagen alpha-1(I) chain-like n=1 Tax=Vidua macroura TaxID=187451 RepID=UPI0023A90B4D|nr:collagen alpha-1(I) chain-like [Vidua macroura]
MTDLSPSLWVSPWVLRVFYSAERRGCRRCPGALGAAPARRCPGTALPRTAAAARAAPAVPPGPTRAKGEGAARSETPRLPAARGDRAEPQARGQPDPNRCYSRRGSLRSGETRSRGESPSATDLALSPARPAALRSAPSAFLQPGSCSRRSLQALSKMVKNAVVLQLWEKDRD